MKLHLINSNRKQKIYKVEYTIEEMTTLLNKQKEEKQDWLLDRATLRLQNER